ncbi:MAG: hypothetical protein ACFN4Y_10310, partial [Centipeda sp. (in: firmicutes)]
LDGTHRLLAIVDIIGDFHVAEEIVFGSHNNLSLINGVERFIFCVIYDIIKNECSKIERNEFAYRKK